MYHLQFSLQAASLETFGYSLTHLNGFYFRGQTDTLTGTSALQKFFQISKNISEVNFHHKCKTKS